MTGAARQSFSCSPSCSPKLRSIATTCQRLLIAIALASRLYKLAPPLCFLVLLAGSTSFAQESGGSITGIVTDSTGGVVAGARVTATNTATSVPTKTTTNTSGNYALLYLIPGTYSIAVEHEGFGKLLRPGIEVRIGDELKLDLQLILGNVEQTVVVEAGTPLVQAENANIGETITQAQLADLPLADGNPFILSRMVAGAVFTGGPQFTRPFDNGDVSAIRVNGAEGGNNFSLNGVSNVGHQIGFGTTVVAYIPPADAVQEFKMTTSSFTAQQGRSAASSIDVSTKSGTNNLHGTLYEFFRNEILSANTFFLNRQEMPRAVVRYNRFGGTVGGPVILPKAYNGRSKTFFFFAYEGLRDIFPEPNVNSVPTLAQRAGDFSAMCSGGFANGICKDRDSSGRIINQIWDPATAHMCGGPGEPCTGANSASVWRNPFPGNIIPSQSFSPIALNYLKYYPAANQPGLADGSQNNYSSQQPRSDKFHSELLRMDHLLSARQKISGTYFSNGREELRFNWAGVVNGITPSGQDLFLINHGITVEDVVTLSPTMLLHLRGGYTRFASQTGPPTLGFDPATLGFSPAVTGLFFGKPYLPRFDIHDITTLNHNLGTDLDSGQSFTANVYSFAPTLTKIMGSHTLNTGYDLRVYRENFFSYGNAEGRYAFNEDFTKQNDKSPTSRGQAVASFLLGQPTGGTISRNDSRANQGLAHAVFVQDDWKASHKFTLNLGLRYEYEGPTTERYNKNIHGFSLTDPNPIEPAARAAFTQNFPNGLVVVPGQPAITPSNFRVLGGYLFADSAHRAFWHPNVGNFQPRLGFAYQLAKGTVFRGGWAIYSVPLDSHASNSGLAGVNQVGFSQTTSLTSSNDAGLHFQANIANPFPNGVLNPTGSSLGLGTAMGQNVNLGLLDPRLLPKTGRWQRWSLGIQRELPGQWLIDAAYVGGHGYALNRSTNYLNAIPPQYLSTNPIRDDATNNLLVNQVPNPFKGLFPGSSLGTSDTIQAEQLLRPFPEFDSITTALYNGSNTYHAGELRVQHRFGHGYELFTTYTWSKTMERFGTLNDFQTMPERNISGDDVPHRLTALFIGQLPFGHTRRWGTSWPRWMDAVLGGWQTGAIYQIQSGRPPGWGEISTSTSPPQRCCVYFGDPSQLRTHISSSSIDQVFDTSGFYFTDNTVQTGGVVDPLKQRNDNRIRLVNAIRAFPRILPNFRGQRQNNWDISLLKKFSLKEKTTLELRGEFLNAFNRVEFNNPNLNPTSADFGRVTSQRNLPREVQVAFKLLF